MSSANIKINQMGYFSSRSPQSLLARFQRGTESRQRFSRFAHVSALRCSPLGTVTAQKLVGRALRLSGVRAEPEAQV
jgi:hypothetical protein